MRLERLETCLPATSYDGLRFPEPPAVRNDKTLSSMCCVCRGFHGWCSSMRPCLSSGGFISMRLGRRQRLRACAGCNETHCNIGPL